MDIAQLAVLSMTLTRALLNAEDRRKPHTSSTDKAQGPVPSDLKGKLLEGISTVVAPFKETPEQREMRLQQLEVQKKALEERQSAQKLVEWRNSQDGYCPHSPVTTLHGGEVALAFLHFLKIQYSQSQEKFCGDNLDHLLQWGPKLPVIEALKPGLTTFEFQSSGNMYCYSSCDEASVLIRRGKAIDRRIATEEWTIDLAEAVRSFNHRYCFSGDYYFGEAEMKAFNSIAHSVSLCFDIPCSIVKTVHGQAETDNRPETPNLVVIGCDLSSRGW